MLSKAIYLQNRCTYEKRVINRPNVKASLYYESIKGHTSKAPGKGP
jgi:hypothetical protein